MRETPGAKPLAGPSTRGPQAGPSREQTLKKAPGDICFREKLATLVRAAGSRPSDEHLYSKTHVIVSFALMHANPAPRSGPGYMPRARGRS